jgi:hypothetical protein
MTHRQSRLEKTKFETRNPGEASRRDQFETNTNDKIEMIQTKKFEFFENFEFVSDWSLTDASPIFEFRI